MTIASPTRAPRVSVLIDTYNHERFIAQAIESVLAQDFPASEMEILVVDDGSTDRTFSIAQSFAPRVRCLFKSNGGQASAFNAGLPLLSGEVIAMLDGDDWWAREKLSRVVEAFDRHPDVGMVGHGLLQTDEQGRTIGSVLPRQSYRLDIHTAANARCFDLLKGFFGTSKVAYRRSILARALPVPESLVIEADEYLWTLAIAQAPALLLNEPLFYYRFHTNNLFMLQKTDRTALRRKYDVLASLLDHLPQALRQFRVPQESVAVLLESLRLDVERHRLQLEGGTPWQMFRLEQAAYRLAYSGTPLGYRLFKALSLALTLLMPPQWFFRLQRSYAASRLRKWRGLVGEPILSAPVIERRTGA